MKKDEAFSNVTNKLIQYYQGLEIIEEDQIKDMFDLEYEICSGRNQLIATSKLIMDNVEKKKCGKEFDNQKAYNNMRGKVQNLINVFEESCILLYETKAKTDADKEKRSLEGDKVVKKQNRKDILKSFQKPQFYLLKYDEEKRLAFFRAYFEIALAQNKNKTWIHRYIKWQLNENIDVDTDSDVINEILIAAGRADLCVDFEAWSQLKNQCKAALLKEIKSEYVNQIMKGIDVLSTFINPDITQQEQQRVIAYTMMEVTKSDLRTVVQEISINEHEPITCITILWEVMLATLMKTIDQLLLGECLLPKDVTKQCNKIDKIRLKKRYRITKEDPFEDFVIYNLILYMQNQYLEEIRLQHHRIKTIKCLKPIEEKYYFTTEDNKLKYNEPEEGNFALVQNNIKEYNDLFHFGEPITPKIFEERINKLKDITYEYNKRTGRLIYPDRDICVFRAFYRAFYFGTQEENSTEKKLYNIWKEYIEKGVMDEDSEYMIYSNLFSCLIHFEYRKGVEHLKCKTKLMKKIYEVMNEAYIQLVYAAHQEIPIEICYSELEEMCQNIFDILHSGEANEQCI